MLLAVARAGGLFRAAQALGVDHATVSRRLTALETALGKRLVERSPRGTSLTAAGAAVVEHVERMEAETLAVSERVGAPDGASGAVRLATPEVFGAYLVAPAAPRLHARHPALRLELVPEARAVNLTKREADLAVTLAPPVQGRLATQKLADYRLGLYASRRYLEEQGAIATLDDLRQRSLVWYVDDLLDTPELRFIDEIAGDASIVFRSTSIAAQHAAVAAGMGVGVLHALAADADPRLERVLADEVCVARSYWLVLHADQRRTPRIRAVADFLLELVQDNRARL